MGFKKGYTPWNKGKKLSIEIVEKMKMNRGGMLGKHHTEETKNKIRLLHKGKHYSPDTEFKKGSKGFTGRHTEETKRRIREISKGKHYCINNEVRKYGFGKRKSIRINGKGIPQSHVSWCIANNIHRVPFSGINNRNGCVIHHIDGNRENNIASNLQLITRDYHIKLHKMLR